MKKLYLLLLLCTCFSFLNAQSKFKQIINKPNGEPKPLQIPGGLPSLTSAARQASPFHYNPLNSISSTHKDISSFRVSTSGSLWIGLEPNDLWSSRSSINDLLGDLIPSSVCSGNWDLIWNVNSEEKDSRNISHIRVEQSLAGHPIHGQDMILHIENGIFRDLNGFAWTGKLPEKLPAPVPQEEAFNSARQYLIDQAAKFSTSTGGVIQKPEDEVRLVWLPESGKLVLTYEVEMHPNMLDHWTVYVDAVTLNIKKAYSQLCKFYPREFYEMHQQENCKSTHVEGKQVESVVSSPPVLDGPTVATASDLSGQNRTVNAYLVGPNFFMIDASRSGMFNSTQSVMPNEPSGVIWTVDGQNGSPQSNNFEVIHVANSNNIWNSLTVSAHHNGGVSYEYFRQTFNRNSLNGNGGNVISIVNVADENGNGLDNAFWSGTAMFYGNGNTDYTALAKSLDVAGHEMSHGVIQNTANLEYIGQSGALNESFADVFGAMIDRDDWRLGEEVVKLNVFPSGALRDLSNPHNGGNDLGDRGWQPAHMNEFQNLPNTPEGDNGGVHVNSGITNHAFFLIASNIGKEKAEQIYYKALKDYLVKSSQFIDMRLAVEKAATDLHGAGSAEVNAVKSGFDAVGIGAGQGGDYEEDIETNTGDDFIIATDETQSDLYWVPPSNPNQFVKMEVPAPLSVPSFTDDGSSAVYVDQDNNMILINFDWSGGTLNYSVFFLDQQGIWRNVVVSKDGARIAYTTSQLLNQILVFDFTTALTEAYTLYNPTTAEGIQTGDVLYSDAMEWDYSGEYIMYDALNRIESDWSGGIEYWDISFLNAWNNNTNSFTDGQIGKLYNTLPENISIGNPSFSKNSPFIITFDFLETLRDEFGQEVTDYWVIAANIESGTLNNIFHNTTIGYPSYSRRDDKIVFTFDDGASLLLATIDLQPGDKTLPVAGSEQVLLTGAQKGVWFQTGIRDFTATENLKGSEPLNVWPDPSADILYLKWNNLADYGHYTITDLFGRPVMNGTTEAGQSIDISSMSPGPYFVSVKSENKYLRTKFVKQ